VTFDTGTQSEVLFAGPPAAYTTGGTSTASAFALTAGATTNFQQPVIRGLLLQPGRNNQLITLEGWVQLTGQASATTFTISVGLNTTPGGTSLTATLLTFPAITVTNYSNGSIYFRTSTINRGSGYGTSSVATNLETSGLYLGQLSSGSATVSPGVVNMTQLATIDYSVNQWVTILGQFNTNSGTNAATLNQVILRGEN